MPRYTDRRVLITGGGSGIGQACVLRILAEGGTVVAADISASGLADTRARAGADAGMLSTIEMDVGDEESVKAGVHWALDTLGGLDTLVNVAGILRSAHFAETSLADFEHVLRVNLVGTFLVTREAIPATGRAGDAALQAATHNGYCTPTAAPARKLTVGMKTSAPTLEREGPAPASNRSRGAAIATITARHT